MKSGVVPGWLVFAGATAVAMTLALGMVVLLVEGRTVPDQLWNLLIAVSIAYFGGGPFSLVSQHQAQTASALLDTVNHSVATTHSIATMSQSGTTGTATSAPVTGNP